MTLLSVSNVEQSVVQPAPLDPSGQAASVRPRTDSPSENQPGQQRTRRRRLWVAGTLSALVVFGAAVSAVGKGPLIRVQSLPIKAVRIGGELAHVSRAELEEVIGLHLKGGFFRTDVDEIAASARALPWVADVSVRRVWPDSLHVAVIERAPIARWNDNALLDNGGEVFVPRRAPSAPQRAEDRGLAQLPVLGGPEGSSGHVLDRWREVVPVLALIGTGVRRMTLSKGGVWRIGCTNGIELVLHDDRFGDLARFAEIYPRLLGPEEQKIASVDLRYTNGFSVGWRPGFEPGVVSESGAAEPAVAGERG